MPVKTSVPRAVWTATIVACIVRLAFVAAYPQFGACPDCQVYDRLATNLLAGKGLVGGTSDDPMFAHIGDGASAPEVGFGPVYPAFLAAIYATVGHSIPAVRVAQAFLGALIVPLAWLLTTAAFGSAAGIVCAWLVALSPPLIMYTGMVLTENLSVALLLASMTLLLGAARRGTPLSFVPAGVALGALILLREEMILLLPAFAGLVWWKARPRPAWPGLAAFAIATLVCVGAWTVRNYVLFHQPILISVHGGEQLWISAKGWSEWHFDDPELRRLVDGRSYVERNAAMQRDAIRIIMASPGQFLVYCVQRMPMLWISSHTTYIRGLTESFRMFLDQGEYARVMVKAALFAVQLLILLLAVLGAWHARRAAQSSLAAWMLAMPIAAVTAVHFVIFATPRYQIPALPFVMAFAALAVTRARRSA
jgi:4-amino-4-deoxy-L-arabinose transferase-like glycosyltransferase